MKFLEIKGFKKYHRISQWGSIRVLTAKILDINDKLYPSHDKSFYALFVR